MTEFSGLQANIRTILSNQEACRATLGTMPRDNTIVNLTSIKNGQGQDVILAGRVASGLRVQSITAQSGVNSGGVYLSRVTVLAVKTGSSNIGAAGYTETLYVNVIAPPVGPITKCVVGITGMSTIVNHRFLGIPLAAGDVAAANSGDDPATFGTHYRVWRHASAVAAPASAQTIQTVEAGFNNNCGGSNCEFFTPAMTVTAQGNRMQMVAGTTAALRGSGTEVAVLFRVRDTVTAAVSTHSMGSIYGHLDAFSKSSATSLPVSIATVPGRNYEIWTYVWVGLPNPPTGGGGNMPFVGVWLPRLTITEYFDSP